MASSLIFFLSPMTVCVECGVSRLVYTSTYNVVFGGQEIKNGDNLEILPDHKVSRWVYVVTLVWGIMVPIRWFCTA